MTTPLQTDLAGIPLRNPVLLAAGASGTLHEMAEVLDLSRVGGLVTKSITRLPREGNPTWRIITAGDRGAVGMFNAIGLANPGVEAFEQHYLPRAAALPTTVIGSVAGFSIEDYVAVAATFEEWVSKEGGLAGIELNVSCPNVRTGTEFGMSPALVREVVTAVRAVAERSPLIVKLSPVTPEIAHVAKAAVDAGASALTISNTLPAMAIDVRTRRPVLANTTGGLSGPALHPVAVKLVWEVHTKVCRDALGPGRHVPIIGAGGVLTWRDAAEFILAGASAVQMGTALFADPRSPLRVVRGLEKWVRSQGAAGVGELVGALRS